MVLEAGLAGRAQEPVLVEPFDRGGVDDLGRDGSELGERGSEAALM
jgi:hypothetical protein